MQGLGYLSVVWTWEQLLVGGTSGQGTGDASTRALRYLLGVKGEAQGYAWRFLGRPSELMCAAERLHLSSCGSAQHGG